MNIIKLSFSLAFLAALTPQARAQTAGSQVEGTALPLKNPGFEEPYTVIATPPPAQKSQITGAIADGWGDSSDWADVAAEYAADTENPHGGETSQRIAVSRITVGAVQMTQRLEFNANQQYVAHVWMRGTPGTSVCLQLRQIEAPWTAYGQTIAKLTDEWQEFTVSGMVTTDGSSFLLFLADKPMTFWVDDAKVENVTETGTKPAP